MGPCKHGNSGGGSLPSSLNCELGFSAGSGVSMVPFTYERYQNSPTTNLMLHIDLIDKPGNSRTGFLAWGD